MGWMVTTGRCRGRFSIDDMIIRETRVCVLVEGLFSFLYHPSTTAFVRQRCIRFLSNIFSRAITYNADSMNTWNLEGANSLGR